MALDNIFDAKRANAARSTGSGLALRADQLRDHNLTSITKSDRRFKDGGAHHVVGRRRRGSG